MRIMDKLFELVAGILLERPVRHRTLSEIRDELVLSGQQAQEHLATAAATPENRETLRHVIGIERWGQNRLQNALGEPLVMDESDEYFPAGDTKWETLREAFRETRRETVALAAKLDQANIDRELAIPHNQWGDLSVHGWLNYLKTHAARDVNGMS